MKIEGCNISEQELRGCIPNEWKESKVVLVHKGGSKKELMNARTVAIIHVMCKFFMMVVRVRINEWVEVIYNVVSEMGEEQKIICLC